MYGRSRSTLFLMEQLIVIFVFAVCAAVCVRVLAESYMIARESRDMSHALIRARGAAECFKAFSGDYGRIAGALGGSVGEKGEAAVYYDKSWGACGKGEASYVLRVEDGASPPGHLAPVAVAVISVSVLEGEDIIGLSVAAREKTA